MKTFLKICQETRNAAYTVIIVYNDYRSEIECKEKPKKRLKIPKCD